MLRQSKILEGVLGKYNQDQGSGKIFFKGSATIGWRI